jgi:hypothetical protein
MLLVGQFSSPRNRRRIVPDQSADEIFFLLNLLLQRGDLGCCGEDKLFGLPNIEHGS